MFILYFKGPRSEFPNDVFISLKIVFTFTNGTDPDETPNLLAFSYGSPLFAKIPLYGYTTG